MSGKRKSPPNKFDADSNSSPGLEASASAKVQYFFNNCNKTINNNNNNINNNYNNINNNENNNYYENDANGCTVRNIADCDFVCNPRAKVVMADEGEGESIMRLDRNLDLGLGLGLAMVTTSDSELTDLDIDTRSISPTASSNASANDSDVDDVDHVGILKII